MTDDPIKESQPPSTTVGQVSDEDLKEEFKRLADELGKKPTKEEMHKHGKYAPTTYENHFGTWNDAIIKAGFEPRRWGSNFEFEWDHHSEWVHGLIQDSINTIFDTFGELEGFRSVTEENLGETTLSNIEQFIETEGADFLKSPQYANEDATEPKRWALTALTSGALLSACRQHDLPIRVDEISSVIGLHTGFEIEDKHISKFKRRVDGAAGQWVSPPPVEQFLKRYADQMSAHPDTLAEALSIVDDLDGNMDPNVAATTALWLGSRETGEPMRRKSLLEMTNVSGPAIRKSIPEGYEHERTIVRFGRKIGENENLTIPKVIVDWLDLDAKYVAWPDVDKLAQWEEQSGDLQTLPNVIVRLDVVEDKPDTTYSEIKVSEYKDGVWEFDVPKEFLAQLPNKILLSWQWDWDQNTGQLVLRES